MKREYDGLRTFLDKCEEFGEIRTISGADWELEIGALTESTSELIPEPPALMFDEVKGYPKGFRVLSLPVASRVRTALALGLPTDLKSMELVREASRRVKNAERVPPKEVETGPVMQNVMRDNEVDLLKFPAIRAHKGDGGRYIGSGDTVINRDPDSGYVNMGTYRMQVHEKNLLGLWQSPGQQGRQIAERYWKEGKPCPGGDVRRRSTIVYGVIHQVRLGRFRTRGSRRYHGPASRSHPRAADRAAHPGPCRNRHRRRDSTAGRGIA